MNNEQKQIVGDAYKNYCDQVKMEWEDGAINELWEDGFIVENSNDRKNVNYRLLTQEEFINKCKTDDGFANTWGLKIEERELFMEERWKMADLTPNMTEFDYYNKLCDEHNIPTKLITITYNNEKIESYE